MDDLTEVLAEIAKLDREATPGPWEAGAVPGTVYDASGTYVADAKRGKGDGASLRRDATRALLVAMRNALPALLAAARREARLREALRKFAYGGVLRVADAHRALAYDGKEEP